MKNGQSIGYTRRRKTKQKRKAICFGHHYMRKQADNVEKT